MGNPNYRVATGTEIKRRLAKKLEMSPDNPWLKAPNWLSADDIQRIRAGKPIYASEIHAKVFGDRKISKLSHRMTKRHLKRIIPLEWCSIHLELKGYKPL